ncbi:hypothetical protein [Thermococcus sp.]|uniref:hypothetical protein n=1 Tax=Thermococcus sp. TaxID=35749 RepID=UPI00261B0CE9|nr:hypothetical protein [Thermococcus sp.]
MDFKIPRKIKKYFDNPLDYFALFTAIFVGMSLGFLVDSLSLKETKIVVTDPQLVTAASAMATIGMAFFVGIQSYFNRKATEEMEKSLLLPLMQEHTKMLHEEIITPLIDAFSRVYTDASRYKVYITLTPDLSQGINGNESINDLCQYLGKTLNTALLEDLLNNHAPDLNEAYQKFISSVSHLNSNKKNPKEKRELINIVNERLKEIQDILNELIAYEVFLDRCPFVRGSHRSKHR